MKYSKKSMPIVRDIEPKKYPKNFPKICQNLRTPMIDEQNYKCLRLDISIDQDRIYMYNFIYLYHRYEQINSNSDLDEIISESIFRSCKKSEILKYNCDRIEKLLNTHHFHDAIVKEKSSENQLKFEFKIIPKDEPKLYYDNFNLIVIKREKIKYNSTIQKRYKREINYKLKNCGKSKQDLDDWLSNCEIITKCIKKANTTTKLENLYKMQYYIFPNAYSDAYWYYPHKHIKKILNNWNLDRLKNLNKMKERIDYFSYNGTSLYYYIKKCLYDEYCEKWKNNCLIESKGYQVHYLIKERMTYMNARYASETLSCMPI